MESDAAGSRKGTSIDKLFEPLAPFAPVVLRFVLAIIIFVHGIGKLFGIGPAAGSVAGFAMFLDSLGVPLPTLFAWVVALVETIGPILLVIGFWTRWAAAAILVDMTMATLLVHAPNGFIAIPDGGIEFTLALAGIALALLLAGPGDVYAIERTVRAEDKTSTSSDTDADDGPKTPT